MKTFKEFIEEKQNILDDVGVGATVVGGGQIAGVGIGPQGEPGIPVGVSSVSKRKTNFTKKKYSLIRMFNRKPPNLKG